LHFGWAGWPHKSSTTPRLIQTFGALEEVWVGIFFGVFRDMHIIHTNDVIAGESRGTHVPIV
jgi:hypothetical protein